MKLLFTVLAACYSTIALAQISFSEPKKFELKLSRYLGETENATYYLKYDFRGKGYDPVTYIKVDVTKTEPIFTEVQVLEIEGKKCRYLNSKLVKGEIIELYGRTSGVDARSEIYILKRDINTFKIIKEPKKIAEHAVANAGDRPNVSMYADENGIFIDGYEYNDDNAKYLKIFDLDFNPIKSIDHKELYPDGKKTIVKQKFHDDAGNLIYQLNLKEYEKRGLFKIRTNYEAAVTGLMIYNVDGERHFVVPELKENMIYSAVKYFYDYTTNTLTGIFHVHKLGPNTMEYAVGSGYAFYKWDVETNEVLEYKTKYFTFGDLVSERDRPIHQKMNKKGKIDFAADYPLITTKPYFYSLPDNDGYLLVYRDLTTKEWDKHIWTYWDCTYMVCLDKNGEEKWSNGISFVHNVRAWVGFGENNQYYIISGDDSGNYTGEKYSFKTHDKKPDVYSLVKIDMSNGDLVSRKKVAPIDKSEYNRLLRYNKKAKKIVFAVNKKSTSTSVNRVVRFGIIDPDKF